MNCAPSPDSASQSDEEGDVGWTRNSTYRDSKTLSLASACVGAVCGTERDGEVSEDEPHAQLTYPGEVGTDVRGARSLWHDVPHMSHSSPLGSAGWNDGTTGTISTCNNRLSRALASSLGSEGPACGRFTVVMVLCRNGVSGRSRPSPPDSEGCVAEATGKPRSFIGTPLAVRGSSLVCDVPEDRRCNVVCIQVFGFDHTRTSLLDCKDRGADVIFRVQTRYGDSHGAHSCSPDSTTSHNDWCVPARHWSGLGGIFDPTRLPRTTIGAFPREDGANSVYPPSLTLSLERGRSNKEASSWACSMGQGMGGTDTSTPDSAECSDDGTVVVRVRNSVLGDTGTSPLGLKSLETEETRDTSFTLLSRGKEKGDWIRTRNECSLGAQQSPMSSEGCADRVLDEVWEWNGGLGESCHLLLDSVGRGNGDYRLMQLLDSGSGMALAGLVRAWKCDNVRVSGTRWTLEVGHATKIALLDDDHALESDVRAMNNLNQLAVDDPTPRDSVDSDHNTVDDSTQHALGESNQLAADISGARAGSDPVPCAESNLVQCVLRDSHQRAAGDSDLHAASDSAQLVIKDLEQRTVGNSIQSSVGVSVQSECAVENLDQCAGGCSGQHEVGYSDQRAVDASIQRVVGISDQRAVGNPDRCVAGISDQRAAGNSKQRAMDSDDPVQRAVGDFDRLVVHDSDQRAVGFLDQCVVGASAQRAVGDSDQRAVGDTVHSAVGDSDLRGVGLLAEHAVGISGPCTIRDPDQLVVGASNPHAGVDSDQRPVDSSDHPAVGDSFQHTMDDSGRRAVSDPAQRAEGDSYPRVNSDSDQRAVRDSDSESGPHIMIVGNSGQRDSNPRAVGFSDQGARGDSRYSDQHTVHDPKQRTGFHSDQWAIDDSEQQALGASNKRTAGNPDQRAVGDSDHFAADDSDQRAVDDSDQREAGNLDRHVAGDSDQWVDYSDQSAQGNSDLHTETADDADQHTVDNSARHATGDSDQLAVSSSGQRVVGVSTQCTVNDSDQRKVNDSKHSAALVSDPHAEGDSVQRATGDSVNRAESSSDQPAVSDSDQRVLRDSVPPAVGDLDQRAMGDSDRHFLVNLNQCGENDSDRRAAVDPVLDTRSNSDQRAMGDSMQRAAGDSDQRAVSDYDQRTLRDLDLGPVCALKQHTEGFLDQRTVCDSDQRIVGDSYMRAMGNSNRRAAGDADLRAEDDSTPRVVGNSDQQAVSTSNQSVMGDSDRCTLGDLDQRNATNRDQHTMGDLNQCAASDSVQNAAGISNRHAVYGSNQRAISLSVWLSSVPEQLWAHGGVNSGPEAELSRENMLRPIDGPPHARPVGEESEHSFYDIRLLIAVIVQLVLLNYKLLTKSFIRGISDTQSPVSSAWRRRQRRNNCLEQVFERAVTLALLGSEIGLATLHLGKTSVDKTLCRLLVLCMTAYGAGLSPSRRRDGHGVSFESEGRCAADADDDDRDVGRAAQEPGGKPGATPSNATKRVGLCRPEPASCDHPYPRQQLPLVNSSSFWYENHCPGPTDCDCICTDESRNNAPSPAFRPGSPARQGAVDV